MCKIIRIKKESNFAIYPILKKKIGKSDSCSLYRKWYKINNNEYKKIRNKIYRRKK